MALLLAKPSASSTARKAIWQMALLRANSRVALGLRPYYKANKQTHTQWDTSHSSMHHASPTTHHVSRLTPHASRLIESGCARNDDQRH